MAILRNLDLKERRKAGNPRLIFRLGRFSLWASLRSRVILKNRSLKIHLFSIIQHQFICFLALTLYFFFTVELL